MAKPTILVVSGHAADFCSRSGGTIAKYVREGCRVQIIALTFGERGESAYYWAQNPNSTIEAAKVQRKKEALAAAEVLGAEIDFCDYDDHPLIMTGERITELAMRIQDIRPDIVLTHWHHDPVNVDHGVTSSVVIRALSCASVPGLQPGVKPHPLPDVFFFESSVPHTEFNEFRIDTYVDITETQAIKLEALSKFTSQPFLAEWYTKYAEHRGHQAGNWTQRTIKYAEGFKRYTPYVGSFFPLSER
ncbi:MAG: hypothetical protein GX354_13015 [Firmicutes bacterium]|jgi:4-oxalomesaconate hydratase|nr:hypothetical protein [Bacillota bacterium]